MQLIIEQDTCSVESPREWSNVATLHCAHRRYDLGDVQHRDSESAELALARTIADNAAGKWSRALAIALQWMDETSYAGLGDTLGDIVDSLSSWESDSDVARHARAWRLWMDSGYRHWSIADLASEGEADSHVLIMPLYLFDHSGISMSTSRFSCPWDSGQVGFATLTKADALRELSCDESTWREAAANCITEEVKTYDQYLTGDVWHYRVEDFDGEVIDSCGGFYGYESAQAEGEAALESAKADARESLSAAKADALLRLKALWQGRRTLSGQALRLWRDVRAFHQRLIARSP
jgi:hypothetical protein